MRRFLYSRWFFLFLAIVCVIDFIADAGEAIWGWDALNDVAIITDIIAAVMACWIFIDLQRRSPTHGNHSRRR